MSGDPPLGFPDALKNNRLPVVIPIRSLPSTNGDHHQKQHTKTTRREPISRMLGGRTHHADINFVGVGVGEEGLGDAEDGVLRRLLHVAPPGGHAADAGGGHGEPRRGERAGDRSPGNHGGRGRRRVGLVNMRKIRGED